MSIARILLMTVLILTYCPLGQSQEKGKNVPAPLFKGMGNYHQEITTENKTAQKYFDQGMVLTYGFNHKEAIRSFSAAAELDPNCAMAYWGIAYAMGPNINAPMMEDMVPKAWEALQRARELAPKASKREQAFIQALSKRYAAKPVKDRSMLDKAYARAMAKVWQDFPEDVDAATLYAEAQMDTIPWKYWEMNGDAKKETREILRALEFALQKDANHPGANHYYIHAVESSSNPERGLPCAYRLEKLCPGAGHLVHMPAHIYLRLGMYRNASLANEKAIGADEFYITQCRAQGFYPTAYYSHNIHFLWYSLCMEGRSEEAIRAGKKTANVLMHADVHKMPLLQWLKSTPALTLVRFGKWDEVLALKKPEKNALYENAMWHYARGIAFVRKLQLENAEKESRFLGKIAAKKDIEKLQLPELPGKSLIELAEIILQAEVVGLQGKTDQRISLLEKAVRQQDDLPYMEPPFWYFPVRQALGAALVEKGGFALPEAEKVFRQDLKNHPNNGWSLFGLLQSLRGQGKTDEAVEVQRRLQEAWRNGDLVLTKSWF